MATDNYQLSTAYRKLGLKLAKEEIYRDRKVSFRSLCRELGVTTKSMDELLILELGMTGKELIASYRAASECM